MVYSAVTVCPGQLKCADWQDQFADTDSLCWHEIWPDFWPSAHARVSDRGLPLAIGCRVLLHGLGGREPRNISQAPWSA